jgi:hypothetical protein
VQRVARIVGRRDELAFLLRRQLDADVGQRLPNLVRVLPAAQFFRHGTGWAHGGAAIVGVVSDVSSDHAPRQVGDDRQRVDELLCADAFSHGGIIAPSSPPH